MDNNLKDILSNLNKDVEQAKLLDYLNKQLSAEDAHDVEKTMADDPFVNDAVEGLHAFNNKKDLNAYVQQLNDDLQKKITKKKSRKEKRRLKDEPWIYFTIVLLLILIIIGYILIKKMT
jgi:hypothetical protein